MIPTRPSRIFRSRWSALFWAAGVIWTAISIAGFGDHGHAKSPVARNETQLTDAAGEPVTQADLATIQRLVDGH